MTNGVIEQDTHDAANLRFTAASQFQLSEPLLNSYRSHLSQLVLSPVGTDIGIENIDVGGTGRICPPFLLTLALPDRFQLMLLEVVYESSDGDWSLGRPWLLFVNGDA